MLRCTGAFAGACVCARRDAFGAAAPLLLRDASAACLAQAVAGLVDPKGLAPGHAAAAAAAAAWVPRELAAAQGAQELAAVLRAMTGEADKEPGKHPAKPSHIAAQTHRLATVLRTAWRAGIYTGLGRPQESRGPFWMWIAAEDKDTCQDCSVIKTLALSVSVLVVLVRALCHSSMIGAGARARQVSAIQS